MPLWLDPYPDTGDEQPIEFSPELLIIAASLVVVAFEALVIVGAVAHWVGLL